ncbi:hypothetical protein [Nonomuraea cavernae]|nr:hypothetical protein [Nonomuraea cavernae]MCA2184667.1 hypothetical protein [Nonomuraea cavernae]
MKLTRAHRGAVAVGGAMLMCAAFAPSLAWGYTLAPDPPPTVTAEPTETVTATATVTVTVTAPATTVTATPAASVRTVTPEPSVSVRTVTPEPSTSVRTVTPAPVVTTVTPSPSTVFVTTAPLPTLQGPTQPGGLPAVSDPSDPDVKMPVAICATPPIPGFACVPATPMPTVTLTAAPAAIDAPMGITVGVLGVIAVGAAGTAVWLVRRNARHSRSRKQNRLPDTLPTNPEN